MPVHDSNSNLKTNNNGRHSHAHAETNSFKIKIYKFSPQACIIANKMVYNLSVITSNQGGLSPYYAHFLKYLEKRSENKNSCKKCFWANVKKKP